MCSSPKMPDPTPAPAPVVTATPPPPAPTADAPVVAEKARQGSDAQAKRRGLSSLRINLNIGGSDGGGGVNMPK